MLSERFQFKIRIYLKKKKFVDYAIRKINGCWDDNWWLPLVLLNFDRARSKTLTSNFISIFSGSWEDDTQWIVMCSVWVCGRERKKDNGKISNNRFRSLSFSVSKENRSHRKRKKERKKRTARNRERDTIWWKFIVSFV